MHKANNHAFLARQREVAVHRFWGCSIAQQVERIDVIAIAAKLRYERCPVAGARSQAVDQQDRPPCITRRGLGFKVVQPITVHVDIAVLHAVGSQIDMHTTINEPERVLVHKCGNQAEQQGQSRCNVRPASALRRCGHLRGLPNSSAKQVWLIPKRPPKYLSGPFW